jgi:3-deoxy-manno-octulosonate cytidylyltransferase (CMP-KDO synthetase)
MRITGVIPARYSSTRFPGKPLALIHGRSMISRVYERCKNATMLNEVVVATDDERIYDHVREFGGQVVMTSESHPSGTDRCAEVASKLEKNPDVIINIQGDEPYIHPLQIDLLAAAFHERECNIATLVRTAAEGEDLSDPNIVKVVRSAVTGKALYFSRSRIPYIQGSDHSEIASFMHIGIYGYRTNTLSELTKLPVTPLEIAEKLEQLRWLEHGFMIHTIISDQPNHSVDTPEDIARIEALFPG